MLWERRLTMSWACRLFSERLNQVKVKLEEVLAGQAREYRDPLAALQNSMQARTRVAGMGLVSCLAGQSSLTNIFCDFFSVKYVSCSDVIFSISTCVCRGAQRAVSAGYPPQARM